MRPTSRHAVNKSHSAKSFRKHSGRTKGINLSPPPMRGGIRL